ncbi:toll/interleukin-1 receptor domain-containing protein [Brevundimonas balnearis]|uniref:Toll/interleukin-1 receptor domain-containing protein n=1 Tax=Brevundimonas balnearis TaxID=1572858 RepID=A0ABV6R0N9_9CAUL
MKIFISWSGQRSQTLALALRDWLPLVLHYAEPWLSTSDIKSGDRWGNEIAKGLQDSNFGIICVTKDNLEAPWLLFESGALAKSMEDGRVIPLRLDLDVSEISGPLTQFQSEKADDDGIKRLIFSLNKCAPVPIAEERLVRLFEPMWPDLKGKVEKIPASGSAPKKTRTQGEILEELVASVRSVEMKFRDVMDDDPSGRRRNRRRVPPGMMMELAHRVGRGPGDPLQLLMFAGLLRDDFPWLYELALETYRCVRDGNAEAGRESADRFREALMVLRRSPFLERNYDSAKMLEMMLMETLEMLPFYPEPSPPIRTKNSKAAAEDDE